MKYFKYIPVLLLAYLFTSCNIADHIGWTSLILLFVVLMGLFAFMFFLIFKRKKQGDKSLAQFSLSVQEILKKYESSEKKIDALKILIKRIAEDEKYKKDTTWRDKVLAKTYLHLATQYNEIGDSENTLNACSEILRLTPDDAMTLYNRGSMYSNIEEYEKALADLNRSIELVDDYASSYNNRGTVFNKLGKQEEAIADFSIAIELENSAISYYNRANVFREQNEISNALLDYEQALTLCGDDEELAKEIQLAKESID